MPWSSSTGETVAAGLKGTASPHQVSKGREGSLGDEFPKGERSLHLVVVSGRESPDLWGSTWERDISPWRASQFYGEGRVQRAISEDHKLVTDRLPDRRKCALPSAWTGSIPGLADQLGDATGGA
ncbi:hypothetical protein [uncultured Ruegeria sp.]|uniref:hypothetical protein n=1 Tax=uncultured Ruegeria sp. TaxID=259304 RepID=UPI00260C581C|nr:hypothetical protein [uncultured Ruegeria sp.]